ncbi:hypothetical protein [uncultured Marivita sp.]|uniref:hypothetical protein n=1 Tax=uncultured Marivita sp. TaxID=888080 RepID=UPI00261EBC5A|nr:hypothetical protein [uncultured Marivita sp.]
MNKLVEAARDEGLKDALDRSVQGVERWKDTLKSILECNDADPARGGIYLALKQRLVGLGRASAF